MHPSKRFFPSSVLALSAAVSLSLLLTGCFTRVTQPASQGGAPVQLSGEITTRSPVNQNDGSRYQSFPVSLRAGEVYRVSSSGALQEPVLVLLDADSRPVAGPSASRLFLMPERDGRHTLSVSGASDTAYGPFRLTLEPVQVTNGGALQPGTEILGVLGDGSAGNTYSLTVSEAGLYELLLSSDMFDALLKLQGNGLDTTDDDSGGGSDAKLSLMLQPGSYQIQAGGYDNTGAGGYSLQVTRRELPEGVSLTNGGELQLGQQITGMGLSQPVEYSLQVAEAGLLRVEMRSSEIDSYLELNGEGVSTVDDDGAGSGYDARIQVPVAAGSYSIKASSMDGNNGLFTLQADLLQARPAGARIEVGELVLGHLQEGRSSRTRLRISEAGNYRIDLMSADFDTLLKLRGQGLEEENDDGSSGTNSMLSLTLQPGDYELISGSYENAGVGSYTLSVSAVD